MVRNYKPTEDRTKAPGEEGRQARLARAKENDQRAIGKDPNHPVIGSQAHADKKSAEAKEKS